MRYYIFSSGEAVMDGLPAFWSNEDGWVGLPSATAFDSTEGNLPMGDGVRWVDEDEACVLDAEYSAKRT